MSAGIFQQCLDCSVTPALTRRQSMTVGARLQSYCEKRLIGNGFVRPDFALPEFEFDRLGFDAEMRIRTWGGLDLTPARPGSKVRGVSPALLSAKRDFDVIMRLLPDG